MITAKQNTVHLDCPVAIIGMGCLFPNAQDAREFWRSIRRGEDGIQEVPATHWSIADYYDPDPKAPDKTYCNRGGFLSPVEFDPTEFGIPPNILEATDTTQLLSLLVAKAALEDAGYGEGRDFNRERVSVVLGVTGTQELVLPLQARMGQPVWRRVLLEAGLAPDKTEQVVRRIADHYVQWQESSFPGLLGNVVAGRIANRLNLRGTNCVVDAACASSLAAVHLSVLELAGGRCDMALTGGADTFNDVFMFMCFSKTPALSPTGDARPFAEDADGTVLGEGVGMIVLKRLEDARRDGDRIYAVIRGIGTSSDGRSQSIYAPHSAGQARALRNAYRLAGFGPESVGLIEAHGTGTKVGDAAEFDALRTVYREGQSDGAWCALGSIKSQIGHTKAAAGVAGMIKAALAIHHRTLPPTIKIDRPSSKLSIQDSPFYLNTELRPWIPRDGRPRRAGVSAFGFGGSNFHVLLEEHEATLPEAAWDGSVQIVALSAESAVGLVEQIDGWLEACGDQDLSWPELAYRAAASRRSFRPEHLHRLVLVIVQGETPADGLRQARERLMAAGEAAAKGWTLPNAFYGGGLPEGEVAFLFPGQGSQYVGMGRDLACTFPEMLDALVEAEAAGARTSGSELRLSDAIYPTPAFLEAEREQQSALLRRTEIAQPAIGAVSLGMCRVLERFGVRPALTAGHSFGELTALCVAGRFDAEMLHTLSRLRGRLMAEGSGDRGTMLAVKAPLAELEALIAAEAPDVVVANRNAPNQGILSGSREAIGRALRVCQARGFVTKPLAVAGAFHSRLMEGAVGPFRQALESVEFRVGKVSVYANATGKAYPADAAEARALLGRQLISPVEFVREVESLYAAGARMFVEVGPKAVLTGLVKSILGTRPHGTVAVDGAAGHALGMLDLARLLARLAAEGRRVDLSAWERPVAEPRKPRMVVPLVGANYRAPKAIAARVEPAPAGQTPESAIPERIPVVFEPPPGGEAPVEEGAFEANEPERRSGDSVAGEVVVEESFAAAESVEQRPAAESGSKPSHRPGEDRPREVQEEATLAASVVEGGEPSSFIPVAGEAAAAAAAHEAPPFVQDGLRAMQRLQQQTAEAHKRFLEVQAQAHTAMMALLAGPQAVAARSDGVVARTPVPASAPRSSDPSVAPVRVPSEPSERREEVREGSFAAAGEARRDHRERADETELPHKTAKTEYAGEDSRQGGCEKGFSHQHQRQHHHQQQQPQERPHEQVLRGRADESRSPTSKEPVQLPAAAKGGGAAESMTAQEVVLGVVSEKTGYPREMIDLDMDIEADLGIDSIKRVEIVAAIEERVPQWTGVRPDQMGGLRTLREIVAAVGSDLGGAIATEAAEQKPDREGGTGVAEPAERRSANRDVHEESHEPHAIAGSHHREPLPHPDVHRDGSDQHGFDQRAGAEVLPPAFAETLLQVVAQLTGYPGEMLNLEMDMEADLGIDSIKRVEILAALEARLPQMPPVKPDHLGELRTLRQIVEYCAGGATTGQGAGSGGGADATHDTEHRESGGGEEVLAEAQRTHREAGRAVPGASAEPESIVERCVLRAVDLAMPSGVQLGRLPIAEDGEIQVTDDGAGLAREIVAILNQNGQLARLIDIDGPPAAASDRGVRGLGGLIIVAPPTCPDGPAWDERSEGFLKSAFALAKSAAGPLRESATRGGALLATVSRMDGAFGLEGGRFDPVQGGLAGLVKTAGLEWPGVLCRAVDVSRSWEDSGAAAAAVVGEWSRGGPIEVGLSRGRRCRLELSETEAPVGAPALSPGEVVVVTGGARGVTAACAEALARSCRPTLVVFGRTAVSLQEPEWLAGLEEEAKIKRVIASHGGGVSGRGPLTPAELQADYGRLMAEREVRRNLNRLAAAGARVVYYRVDLREPGATRAALESVRKKHGPVRGLIHAAGVIADRRIDDKTPEQFAAVFDTKVGGLRHLLAALPPAELRHVAFFSSVSGRFGNVGQVDYATANEVLNKAAWRLAAEWPGCRVVSINWGAWDGGMVTPALRREFERRGVALLPLPAGALAFVSELGSTDGSAVEVIISAARGNAETRRAGTRRHEAGTAELGADRTPTCSDEDAVEMLELAAGGVGPQVSVSPGNGESNGAGAAFATAFGRTLDLPRHPFLRSHVIDGHSVLPVALMVEWLGHAAIHANPGLRLHGMDDLRILRGVVLRDEPPVLRFLTAAGVRRGSLLEVPVELREECGGARPGTLAATGDVLHARATAVLAGTWPTPPALSVSDSICERRYARGVRSAYRDVLFHGEHFHGIEEVVGYSSSGMIARLRAAPKPANWMVEPLRSDWLGDPLVLDSCFQMGVLWCYEEMGVVGLPTYLRHYRQYRPAIPQAGVRAFLEVRERTAHKVVSDVTVADHAGVVVVRIEGFECTADASLMAAFHRVSPARTTA